MNIDAPRWGRSSWKPSPEAIVNGLVRVLLIGEKRQEATGIPGERWIWRDGKRYRVTVELDEEVKPDWIYQQ